MTLARRWTNQDAYAAEIEAAAQSFGIPLGVAFGLVAQESGFNASAIGDGGRSFGLVQMQLTTARGLGFQGTGQQLLDPSTNVTLGMRYLSDQVRRAGSIEGGLSAYNGGYRPSSGYGAPRADGTYANQSYVTAVLGKAAYFDAYLAEQGTASSTTQTAGAGGILGWFLGLGLVGAIVSRFRHRKR